jgi:hypothetical protein
MRPGPTVETSDDVHAAQLVERALGQASTNLAATPRRCSREPAASTSDADVIESPRRPQKTLVFVVLLSRPRSKTPEWAQPRDWPPPHEAAQRRDEHQEAARTPKQSDLKFFVFYVGITAGAHQRPLTVASAAAWCSVRRRLRMSDGTHLKASVRVQPHLLDDNREQVIQDERGNVDCPLSICDGRLVAPMNHTVSKPLNRPNLLPQRLHVTSALEGAKVDAGKTAENSKQKVAKLVVALLWDELRD